MKEVDNTTSKVMQSSFMSNSSKKLKTPGAFSKVKSAYQSAYPLGKDFKGEKETIERYKNVIEKLQSTLEVDKKKLKQARLLYAKEMQAKTELEELLYQCVEEIKNEAITKKMGEKSSTAGTCIGFIYLGKKKQGEKAEFTKEQREKIVEMLLSQERVLALLYDKTFPPKQEDEKNAEDNKQEEKAVIGTESDQPSLDP